jgi:hypothetical protein
MNIVCTGNSQCFIEKSITLTIIGSNFFQFSIVLARFYKSVSQHHLALYDIVHVIFCQQPKQNHEPLVQNAKSTFAFSWDSLP